MKCGLCDVHTRFEVMERVDVFPLDKCCPACVAELREDDADPIDHEAREECGR